MKRMLMFAITAEVVVSLSSFAQDRVLETIAHFETGAKRDSEVSYKLQPADHKLGRRGEVTRYQILPININEKEREYNPGENNDLYRQWSHHVASRILTERITYFHNLYNQYPTTKEIYILWNAPAYLLYGKKYKGKKVFPPAVETRANKFVELFTNGW